MTNICDNYKPTTLTGDEILAKMVEQGERSAAMQEQILIELRRIEQQLRVITEEQIDEIDILEKS
jgi:hypothetical protein